MPTEAPERKPMRVLQLHNRYGRRGGEDSVVELEAGVLREAGHLVTEVSASNNATLGVEMRNRALAPWNPFTARELTKAISEVEPDVVHVHNTWYSLSPSVIASAARAGVPTVMTLHNYRLLCANAFLLRDGSTCQDCVGRTPLPAIRHRCYRGSVSSSTMAAITIGLNRTLDTWDNVDVFLVLTDQAKEIFVRGGLDRERIVVKPNFTRDPGRRHSPPSDSNTVLLVGRPSEAKGFDFLAGVWAKAAPPGINLEVIGGSAGAVASASARFPGLTFTGQLSQDEVTAKMLDARALLFPSLWEENTSMVALEAIAAGLPVMASNVGALGQLLAPHNSLWRPERGDESAWAASMSVLSSDEEVDTTGARLRETYEARFGLRSGLEGLESAYQRARQHRVERF